MSYRGAGALRSGGAFGEGLNCGGSDTEQVCVSHKTLLPAAKLHVTVNSYHHMSTFDMR